jgi:hypothetical protein
MNELGRNFLEYARRGQVDEVVQCLEQEPSLCNIKDEVSVYVMIRKLFNVDAGVGEVKCITDFNLMS